MRDVRDEIRAAFDKRQSDLGDVEEQSERILRAAKQSPSRPQRQLWPTFAGVGVVLLAAAAVATSIVVRGSHPSPVSNHPSPTATATPTAKATPSASTAPTPLLQPLQVPASVPVILFRDPADATQLDATTWDGSTKGRIGTNPDVYVGFISNPAGTLYATTLEIRDRTNAVVATPSSRTKGFAGTWADDGTHYCSMVSESPVGQPGGEPATLQLTAVGQAPRNVVQVGRVYDQTSAGVAACSIQNDQAVAVQSASDGEAVQFWVVQLSTGRVLWTRPSGDIRASRDGRFIAEIIYNQGTQRSTTTIYSSTGVVLGHLPGRIEAFSWDGSLAVQAEFGGPVSVIRWRDGTVVWTGPAGEGYYDAMPEPSGQRLAVSLTDPAIRQTGGFPAVNVYVVSPDGTSIELLKDVM